MSRGEGEFHHEVYTKRVPSRVRDPEGVQFTYRSLPYRFRSKTEVTDADVLPDIPRHLRPPVVPGYQLQCFPASGMSSDLRIMTQRDYLPP